MKGTEKQVAYAKDLIDNAVADIRASHYWLDAMDEDERALFAHLAGLADAVIAEMEAVEDAGMAIEILKGRDVILILSFISDLEGEKGGLRHATTAAAGAFRGATRDFLLRVAERL